MKYGKIYLIPCPLGEDSTEVIPGYVKSIVNSLDEFVVEDEKSARRYLKKMEISRPLQEINLQVLNEHTPQEDVSALLKPVLEGKNLGILSEAGCPAIADPGSDLVKAAHEKNIKVIPLVGPSSILLALMASGFNGQSFCFNGYLPKEKSDRIKKLKELESLVYKRDQTQLFIETPYRNQHLFEDIIKNCSASTMLCIACDLTLSSEFIRTMTVTDWKKNVPDLNKRPAIFLLYK